MKYISFVSALILSILCTLPSAAGAAVEITRVTPTGEGVEATRQIAITFNEKMVPLGRMERTEKELGISVSPALKCEWRWLDPQTLSCELSEANEMKLATQYTVTLKAGLKSLSGAKLERPFVHKFSTLLPIGRSVYFNTWRGPGSPQMQVAFNQPVTRASVLRTLVFRSGKDQVPAKIVEENHRDNPSTSERWHVEPARPLPLDRRIEVALLPGLASAQGPLDGPGGLLMNFDTFPEFRFVGIDCWDINQNELKIRKSGDAAKCSPLAGVRLVFTAPVHREQLKKNLVATPAFAPPSASEDAWGEDYENVYLGRPHKKGDTYNVQLPAFLKANTSYSLVAQGIEDAFSRQLKSTLSFKFNTDARQPAFVVPYMAGVLEKEEKTDIPAYVTNIDEVSISFTGLTEDGPVAAQNKVIKPAPVKDLSFAIPLEIRTLLGGRSGAVSGKFFTSPSVNEHGGTFFYQVTPYQVHAKLGHYNSLVWVTDLKTGNVVSGAQVSFHRSDMKDFSIALEELASAKTDSKGIAQLKGHKELGGPDPQGREIYLVKVVKGDDIALLPLNYDFQISSYQINSDVYATTRREWGHIRAWGATAQGVYKAGDKIDFKIYVRNHNSQRFELPPLQTYSLIVRDPTGKEAFTRESIELNDFGAFHGEFSTATSAPVGWYTFELKSSFSEGQWEPLRVLVSDFTPIPFKVETILNASTYRPGEMLRADTIATMHAGGPYASAPVRVTGLFKSEYFASKHPKTADFVFDKYRNTEQEIFQIEETLSPAGRYEHSVALGDLPHHWGRIMVEGAVADDRGKNVASLATATYSGLDRRIGLKSTAWVFNRGEQAKFLAVVVDDTGKPLPAVPYKIQVQYEEIKVSKVKGAGNAYLNNYTREWVEVSKCDGTSQEDPTPCNFVPEKAGSYRLLARVQDSKGRPHEVSLETYVVGKGTIVWDEGDNFALPLIPERTDYKVGDTARFLVKNPFPGATALVTVERYGVHRSWLQKLDNSAALIDVKLEEDDVPGFYLSVAVVSPRVQSAEPLGQVDLGKPAFRMGVVQVDVRDPYKEILVSAKAAKDTYRPRDKVEVSLTATPRNRPKNDQPIELAVAVLDEAVLALIQGGTDYYDPYKGFNELDGLDVLNYNLLTRLVGRQKFEKKGANPGGDGGANDAVMRSLFKFVTYWNPSIKTDSKGRANIDFTVPDNLTGWRVLAMAVTPGDRMGLGQGNFKVNKPTEIRPVMPNVVTEGDTFKAGFSVMNRTDKPRKLNVAISVEGTMKGDKGKSEQTVDMAPNERKTVWMNIETKSVAQDRNATKGKLSFKIQAGDALDKDGLVHAVDVLKRRSLETAAVYGSTTEAKATEEILFPKDIYTDIGSVSLTAAPSVIGNVEGSFRYMRDYPYICWEQKLSKAVMASHFQRLKAYVPGVSWPEAESLVPATMDLAASYQAPNGGMSFFRAADEYVSPYLSAYTAVAFTWLREAGHKVPEAVEKKLHDYLKNMLRNKVVPTFYDEGMESSVRAIALYALAKTKSIAASDVKRYFAAMPKMSLFGKAYFMMAALEAGQNEDQAKQTMTKILASSNQTAGKFMFNDVWDDRWERLLATPVRDNCIVLSGVVKYAKTAEGKKLVGDVPMKLVRSLTQTRGSRDYFENTQENLYCMQSMIDYASVYESVTPNFKVTASVANKAFGSGTFTKVTDPMQTYERPIGPTDPGTKATVQIDKAGDGRLYYSARVSFAPKEEKANGINAGVDIRREYHVERNKNWVLLGPQAQIKRGELVRVDLYVSLPASRNYLVVNDPVPGGLEPVNRDLANESTIDADKAGGKYAGGAYYFKFRDWIGFEASRWSFYHKELRHDSARFYSEYLMPGNYHLSYTAQAIASGTFAAPATMAEEMYDPDVYGKSKPVRFTVQE